MPATDRQLSISEVSVLNMTPRTSLRKIKLQFKSGVSRKLFFVEDSMGSILVKSARLTAKGQITLPKDIREALGLQTGDSVSLIRKANYVIMMNSTIYAIEALQAGMAGEAEKAGLHSEEDVIAMIATMRNEENGYSRLDSLRRKLLIFLSEASNRSTTS